VIEPELVPRILVAGIGNILLQDDWLGPQAIARLQAEYEMPPDVELLDIGTPTLDFVDYLAGREVVILLDALSCGGEAGEVVVFQQSQLREHLPGMRLSAHQPCLSETLFAAENAGIEFKELLLIGVVGCKFEVSTELGPEVSRAMPSALSLVCEILAKHGVTLRKREMPVVQDLWWSKQREEARQL
jgi:hydrogenase maturation protease